MSKLRPLELIVVGDGACGKTSMLQSFVFETFTEEYIPTIFETQVVEVLVKGVEIDLVLKDTAGQEAYGSIRTQMYSGTDVVLLCFSVDNHVSLENAKTFWLDEIREHCPNAPIVLVCNKIDLREKCVYDKKASKKKVAIDIGAVAYVECSAKTREGICEVFEAAAEAGQRLNGESGKKKKKKCTII